MMIVIVVVTITVTVIVIMMVINVIIVFVTLTVIVINGDMSKCGRLDGGKESIRWICVKQDRAMCEWDGETLTETKREFVRQKCITYLGTLDDEVLLVWWLRAT